MEHTKFAATKSSLTVSSGATPDKHQKDTPLLQQTVDKADKASGVPIAVLADSAPGLESSDTKRNTSKRHHSPVDHHNSRDRFLLDTNFGRDQPAVKTLLLLEKEFGADVGESDDPRVATLDGYMAEVTLARRAKTCHVLTQFLGNSVVNILAIDLIKHIAGVRFHFLGNVVISSAVQLTSYALNSGPSLQRIEKALTAASRFCVVCGVLALFAPSKAGHLRKLVDGVLLTGLHLATSPLATVAGRCFRRMCSSPHAAEPIDGRATKHRKVKQD